MFAVKLLANSAIACNWYIILNMPSIFTFRTFHILHITWDIMLQLIIVQSGLQCFNELYQIKFKRANQISCTPSKSSQLNSVVWRTCDRIGKQFFKRMQEKLWWSFDEARNVLIGKMETLAVKKIFPLDLAKYLSHSELKKNREVDNV